MEELLSSRQEISISIFLATSIYLILENFIVSYSLKALEVKKNRPHTPPQVEALLEIHP
jgi:hypothetical protein